MKCSSIRHRLEAAFDLDAPPDRETEAHLAYCASCKRYRTALTAIDRDLRSLPDRATPTHLTERVKRAVMEERSRRKQPSAARWAAGMLVCSAAVITGWVHPLPWDIRLWWSEVDAWRDPGAWDALGMQMMLPFRELWVEVAGLLDQSAGLLSPILLWSGVGATALVLVLFNAIEALHIGMATRRGISRRAGS